MNKCLSQLQTFETQTIIFSDLVLFDVTPRFERRQQTKDVVLVQFKPFAELRNANFIDIAVELFQHVERV